MKNRELTFKRAVEDDKTLRLINMSLCFSGVRSAFPGIPKNAQKVTFVFSQRPQPEAAKITFECHKDDYDLWKEMDVLCDRDYELHLDGTHEFLTHSSNAKIRELWDQGYNYIRCEYDS